jgi:hypothetical protein
MSDDHLIVNGGTNSILHNETWTTDSARVGLPPELLPGQGLAFYPNPSEPNDTGWLLFDSPQTGFCSVTITDALGRLCRTTTVDKPIPGVARLALPIGQLAAGVYSLTVRQDTRLVRTRMVVR